MNIDDTSYIIKTKIGDKYFIINRNKTMIDAEVKPSKAIQWWGLDDKKFRAFVLSDIEILEEVPFDNYEHRHQKQLNLIKQEWRERLGGEVETTNISDESIHNLIQARKRQISKAYEDVKHDYHIMVGDDHEIKRITKDLILGKYYLKFAGYERWRIYKHADSFPSRGHLIFYLFNKKGIESIGKRCYGIWINHKNVWSTLEECVTYMLTNGYEWKHDYFKKIN